MFGAEAEERITPEELEEFERETRASQRHANRGAALAAGALLLNICLVIPFLAGHPLHSHWEKIGKYLVSFAMVTLLWCVQKVGYAYASYEAAKEMRKGFRYPED